MDATVRMTTIQNNPPIVRYDDEFDKFIKRDRSQSPKQFQEPVTDFNNRNPDPE